MFRRFKREDSGANRLRDESEPNELSWTSDEADLEEDEEFDEDEEDLDEDEGEGRIEDLDEEAEETEADKARRAEELQAELQRQAEEFGLTGSSPTVLYGPNGQAVADLLNSLDDIDDRRAEAIVDAYDAMPDAERRVAQSVVSRRFRGGELGLEIDEAERAITDWLASLRLSGADLDLYRIVAQAAIDAVDALVLQDQLEQIDFDTLYDPWVEGMSARRKGKPGKGGKAAQAGKGGGKGKAAPVEEGPEEEEEEEDAGEFGPNTEVVLQFLTKLAEIDAAQISKLVARWREQPKEELRLAHRNLQSLADEDARWREQLRLAQEEVFAWMAGHNTETKRDYSFGDSRTVAAIRDPAGPVVADAVAALVMADVLEPEDAKVLYAPWARVIRTPKLPEFAEEEEDDEE